jgi:hypothetical protein
VPFKKGVYQGNKNANSRLTEGQVVIIKRDLALGVPAPALARLHQVSAETIRRIGRGETWGWLGDGVNQPSMDSWVCFYCGEPGNQEDHWPPQTWMKWLPKRTGLLVRCCQRCNNLLGNSFQETLEERKEIARRLVAGEKLELELLSENEIAYRVFAASVKWTY